MVPEFFNKYPYTDFHELNLDWLLNHYKEFMADLAAIKEWIENDAHNYNDVVNRINALEVKSVSLQNQINNTQLEFDQKLRRQKLDIEADYTALYRSLLNEMNSQIISVRADLGRIDTDIRMYSDAGDQALKDYLDARIATFIENLPDYNDLIIYNPVRGYNTIVQTAINDLYNYFNAYGLTAAEYDSMGLTAQEYDDYELTANEYDSWGRKLLPFPDPDHYMRDPFTGLMAKFETVIMELFGLHRGGISAEDYDNLELTANDYDGREIPAYIYDMVGIS